MCVFVKMTCDASDASDAFFQKIWITSRTLCLEFLQKPIKPHSNSIKSLQTIAALQIICSL